MLCKGLPDEFCNYMNYVKSMKFDDKPDYFYLRELFRKLFYRTGLSWDYMYDWTLSKSEETAINEYKNDKIHISLNTVMKEHSKIIEESGNLINSEVDENINEG